MRSRVADGMVQHHVTRSGNMTVKPMSVFAAAFLVSSWSTVSAAVLFSQPIITRTAGPFSDSTFFYAPGVEGQILADDFTLQKKSALSGVTWFGDYSATGLSGATPREFVVELYRGGTDLPSGIPIYQQTLSTAGVDIGDAGLGGRYDIFEYNISLPHIIVNAGERHWLSIFENDPTTDTWFWFSGESTIGSSIERAFRNVTPDPSWRDPGGSINQAFNLHGAVVPVPAAAWLLISAVGMLGFFGRRNIEA
jgi:hypothetical protein